MMDKDTKLNYVLWNFCMKEPRMDPKMVVAVQR